MTFIYLLLGLIVVIVAWLIFTFNKLVKFNIRAKEALSDVDVQLKRRFDLIPNLISTVKGYIKHEKDVLTKVTEARTAVAQGKQDPLQRDGAENMLSGTLKTLFAVSENYPDLKANANFLDLQRELADTENKIQASRRFYNSTVMEFNTAITVFPTNLIAGLLKFSSKEFFKTDAESKENVKVDF